MAKKSEVEKKTSRGKGRKSSKESKSTSSSKTKKKSSRKPREKISKAVKKPITKEPGKTAGRPKPSKKDVPKTMEELLEQTGYELRGVKRGELIDGTITDISKKMVLLDIGSKTEGMVVDKEFEAARDFISELSMGDTVPVYVLSPENDRGQILLSLRKVASDRMWQKYEEAKKTGEIVTVFGLEVNRGGIIVRAGAMQGFVPASQFGKEWLGNMGDLVNKRFKVRVIEVDREENRLIFSEKEVSEADELEQRAKALDKIKVDEMYEGSVSGIMPFGVFVTVDVPLVSLKGKKKAIGSVEGLVHISEISWEKVDDPNDFFKVGNRMKVKVLGIDSKSGKLNLSVKRLSEDPWEKIGKKYPSGKKVKGTVTRVAPFGAFVNLEPGIEGLLHISKIPAGEEPEVGKKVDIFVEQVDLENRRMSLGMVLKEVPVGYK